MNNIKSLILILQFLDAAAIVFGRAEHFTCRT
jgi:hypothetical protein